MDNQHDETSGRDDGHGERTNYFADFCADILSGWFTLLVSKVRRIVRKAQRKRQ